MHIWPARPVPRWPERQQIRQAVGDAVAGPQYVRTYDELVTAVGRLVQTVGADGNCKGRGIIITSDIECPAPIDLSDAKLSGLSISSLARSVLYPVNDAVGGPCFIIEPPTGVVTGLYISNITLDRNRAPSTYFSVGIRANDLFIAVFENIDWTTDDALFSSTGTCKDIAIRGAVTGLGGRDIITGDIDRAIISSCQEGDITLGASGREVVVMGNLSLGVVDTSGSQGFNVIVGNSGTTSILRHATDAVGLNT